MENQDNYLAELEKQLAIFKAQNAQLKDSLNRVNKKNKKTEQKVDELQKKNEQNEKESQKIAEENEKLKNFIIGLKEEYNVERMYNWAKRTEKFKPSELVVLKKLLQDNEVNPNDVPNQNICENDNDVNNDSSTALNDDSNKNDGTPAILNDDSKTDYNEIKPIGPKKRGRQPNIKTCGRNNEVFNYMDEQEIIIDDKKSIEAKYPGIQLKIDRTKINKQIDYIEAHVRTRKITTIVYKDKLDNIYSSKLNNPRLYDFIKDGKLTNRMIASIATDKLVYGQPIYLLANKINLISRHDVVNAQLLNDNFLKTGERLEFFVDLIRKEILKEKCFHADETRLKVINYDNKTKPGSKLGYIWELSCKTKNLIAVYYRFDISRASKVARTLINGATSGALQVDGYQAYVKAVREENARIIQQATKENDILMADQLYDKEQNADLKGLILVGCLSHARRKFYELQESVYKRKVKSPGYVTCTNILARIMKIYQWENITREEYNKGLLSEEEFIKKRKSKADAYLQDLLDYANERLPIHSVERRLERSLKYLINQQALIKNYVLYSDLTCDNNFCERLMKPIIRTRNNSLFASNERGAKSWATLTSITQSAILNNINPTHYLKYLLDNIGLNNEDKSQPIDYNILLPWNVDYKIVDEYWLK